MKDDLRNAVYRLADAMGWPVVKIRSGRWVAGEMFEWATATAECSAEELNELAETLLEMKQQ